MKERGDEHLKPTIYDKTLSTAGAVPLPHAGKAYMEAALPQIYMGDARKRYSSPEFLV